VWSQRRGRGRVSEDQLAALRKQIAAAEAQLVEKQTELVELRLEAAAFEREYETRVGRKYRVLEETEAAIARCKKQIADYRQWGDKRPKTRWGSDYVSVEEQYRRTWREPAPPGPAFPPPPVSPTQKRELKTLYRELCRRYHPDLTQDPDERVWRTEMMAAVNAAYEARSITELEALAARPERVARTGGADQNRLEALTERLHYLQQRVREVEREIDEWMHGPLVEIRLEVRLAARQGQDLLSEMAAEVEKDLERKQVELDFLQAQLRQLGIACE
jgi:chromosome segregation ATPase